MPLPKPREFERGDEYKLSLSLEHYNFHTSWMRIVEGKRRSISIPLVHVTMVYAGEEVRSFRAKVVPLPKEYSRAHEESVSHFRNETHWPKLLVVKYEWEERDLGGWTLGSCHYADRRPGDRIPRPGDHQGLEEGLAEFARESMADMRFTTGRGRPPRRAGPVQRRGEKPDFCIVNKSYFSQKVVVRNPLVVSAAALTFGSACESPRLWPESHRDLRPLSHVLDLHGPVASHPRRRAPCGECPSRA